MNPAFQIGDRWVGSEFPPLVVAEIGINHGGSLEVALQIAESAIKAGAEVIKHQTHIPWDEMSQEAKKVVPGNSDKSIYEIIESCSLDESDELELMRFVKSRGAYFISTPFSREAVKRIAKMDLPAVKIGSGECNNLPLVKLVAELGKPIILSTGMNSIESIAPAVEVFRKRKLPFALLHCTNLYPTAAKNIRLGAIPELHQAFPDAVIGLSDHSLTNYPCIASVALGARILERHYVDTRSRIGPDIPCSMDQKDLGDLIAASQIVYEASRGGKRPLEEERVTIAFAFASVVATTKISPGESLTSENIWVRRPSGGDFSANQLESLYQRKAKTEIPENTQIREWMLDS
jgi:N-acetylneuraminate synthase